MSMLVSGITKMANVASKSKFYNNKLATKGALKMAEKHMPAAMGIWMTAFYAINNLRSDKIPKERKIPLLINDLICCATGTIGGYALSGPIFAFKDAVAKKFMEANKALPAEKLARLGSGLNKIVPLLAFTFMFRYLGPVIATPLADKINKFLVKKGVIADYSKAKNKPQEETKPAAQNIGFLRDTNKVPDVNFDSFLKKVGFENANKTFIA